MASENRDCGQTWTSSSDSVSSTVTCPSPSEKANVCEFDLRSDYNNLQQQYSAVTTHLDQLDLKVKQLQQNTIQLQDKNRTACQENQAVLKEIADTEKCNKELYEKSLCLKANVNKYCQLGQHLKDKLECENEKIQELNKYISKCKEENARQLSEKQQQLDVALEEKRQLQTSATELKQRLEQLRTDHLAKKKEYKNVMQQIAEVECELTRLNAEIDNLSEELSQLKSELEKANEEYKKLHAEHCLIKDNMLHQEDERQKAFDYFFEQESKVMALEKEIEELTKEKNDLVVKNEEARALGLKLSKKITAKEDSIEQLDQKIADIKQKQVCVNKKISKAETLIKHLVANRSKIIAAGNN